MLDYAAFKHDKDYDLIGATGAEGLLSDIRTIEVDKRFLSRVNKVLSNPISSEQEEWALRTSIMLQYIIPSKMNKTVKSPPGVSLHLRR